MVSAADVLGLAIIVLVHTAIAALLTRFFRVRMKTAWAGPLYAGLLGSVTLLATTLVFGGVLRLGPNLVSPAAVVGVTIVGPLSIGMAFDYFWMPAPEAVEVPDRPRESPPETQ